MPCCLASNSCCCAARTFASAASAVADNETLPDIALVASNIEEEAEVVVEKRGVAGTISKGVLIVKFVEDDEEMFEDEGKGVDVSPFKGGIGVSADEFDATISAPF